MSKTIELPFVSLERFAELEAKVALFEGRLAQVEGLVKGSISLGAEAPKEVPVHRREVYDAIKRNEANDATP